MKGRIKKKGDFIKLIGGSMEIGEIISIDKTKLDNQFHIKLLISGDKNFYNKTEIIPIYTNKHHLISLGFEEIHINKQIFFNLYTIYIIPESGSLYLIDAQDYPDKDLSIVLENQNISPEKHLNINNINDVFSFLKKKELLTVNTKKVLLSSNYNF